MGEKVKVAVESLMAELAAYLVARSEPSKLAWTQGIERLRCGFVDRLRQEVQKGMTPIYAEVEKATGRKVQIQRTTVLSELLNKDFGKLLDTAVASVERHIRDEVEGGSLLSLLATTMVDGAKEKFAAEQRLLFEKYLQSDEERQEKKQKAEQMQSARHELHELVGRAAAKGLNIEIQKEGEKDTSRVETVKAALRKKITTIGKAAVAVKQMKSDSEAAASSNGEE